MIWIFWMNWTPWRRWSDGLVSLQTLPTLLGLLRLRAGPQDLPADQGVLVFWMGASLLAGLLVAGPVHGAVASLFLGVLDLIVLYIFIMVLLGLNGLTPRWLQTYIALVGASALLGFIMSVLVWVLPPELEQAQAQISPLVVVAYLGLLVWLLMVFGHILQQALQLASRMAGVAIALGFLILSSLLTQLALDVVSP